ncbi:MAG TPA: hypothetical protein VGE29_07390 [Prosthecobacter sp.]
MEIFRSCLIGAGLALASLAMVGCERRQATVKLPQIEVTDVPVPSQPAVVIRPGDVLNDLAETAYGHENFSDFIQRFNGIADVTRLQVGFQLQTPSLAAAFQQKGLDARYQPAVNALALAWTKLTKCLPDYERARAESGAKDGNNFGLPKTLKSDLEDIVTTTTAVLQMLKNPAQGHTAPKSAILRLEEALGMVRKLALGRVDSHDYDIFLTGDSYALVFDHLLIWVQTDYQRSK